MKNSKRSHDREVCRQLIREDENSMKHCMACMYVAACIAIIVAWATGWTINPQ